VCGLSSRDEPRKARPARTERSDLRTILALPDELLNPGGQLAARHVVLLGGRGGAQIFELDETGVLLAGTVQHGERDAGARSSEAIRAYSGVMEGSTESTRTRATAVRAAVIRPSSSSRLNSRVAPIEIPTPGSFDFV
jgi:hypothetical protein